METLNRKDFFSVSIDGAIASVKFNECPISCGTNLIAKDRFLSQFDRISENDKIKVIIFFFSSEINSCRFRIFENNPDSIKEEVFIKRIHNSMDQYRMRIMNCSKITLSVDSSKINTISLNLGLSCDYKLFPEGVVFQNSYYLDNLIPMGGETYFLRQILGKQRMFDFFFFNKEIDQSEAMKIGLVNEVLQEKDLERVAYERAQKFTEKPYYYIAGVKKLLSCSDQDLDTCLNLERKVIDYSAKAHKYFKKIMG